MVGLRGAKLDAVGQSELSNQTLTLSEMCVPALSAGATHSNQHRVPVSAVTERPDRYVKALQGLDTPGE